MDTLVTIALDQRRDSLFTIFEGNDQVILVFSLELLPQTSGIF